jgi:hypothetical protein
MFEWRKVILFIIVGSAFTAPVWGDMMSAGAPDAEWRESLYVRIQTDLEDTNYARPFSYPNLADLGLVSDGFMPEASTDAGQTHQTQSLQILTEGQNSFILCMYALIGLGLCRSAPLVKNLSFGCIPEWYHNGGPSQIGHSFAISPDCLCDAPALCFVQPDCPAEDISPEYYKGIIAPLLRKSLFTPNVLASRGPPNMS